MSQRVSLDTLNKANEPEFVRLLDGIFEHASWVANAAFAARPYRTVAALHDALMVAVRTAPRKDLVSFVQAHPDLAGKAARAGQVTPESASEQAGLGLDRFGDEDFARFEQLNAAYRHKFDFPFVICVRRQTRDAILDAFERRLGNDPDQELAAALEEIGSITRLRLVDRVEGPGTPEVAGRLSTHVLDTYHGRPASGVALELFEIGRSERARVAHGKTNQDGRTDQPLIAGCPLRAGTYELHFHIGDYFNACGVALPIRPFLSVVPVRFGISEPEGHYHVPLLVTPWSYSTYRGS
jgi:2-oxo-4-hydroxy-4-carboxy-5-ureidoimidazoline decarboxylase